MEDEFLQLAAGPDDTGHRLDAFICAQVPNLSRNRVQELVTEGKAVVNAHISKPGYRMREGDRVEVLIPEAREDKVEPENLPLDILYEDGDVVVVNKNRGMVVHPAPGNFTGTLVNALLWHCHDLSGINGVLRPGIIHRIDKDTSGVLVVAKNDKAHLDLATQIKEHSMHRIYDALVHGDILEQRGRVEAPIGRDPANRQNMKVVFRNSKAAVTHYEVRERFGEYTLIEAKLETGRTHQIRVHMAYIKHPVVGDPRYGPRIVPFGLQGQVLHARMLGFKHPSTGKYMEFEAPLPPYFYDLLENLRQKKAPGSDKD
ncbi:MAG: RluA family pseudouridine synthase [Bacillota bacterium]